MNRRGFLKRLGGAAAAGSALVAVPVGVSGERNADDFTYRGHRIKWHGWVQPVNQIVQVGFWAAVRPERGVRFVASTSMGHVGEYHDTNVVMLYGDAKWPMITMFSTDAERDAVKERARLALMETLVQ